jgi:hypothetical protein
MSGLSLKDYSEQYDVETIKPLWDKLSEFSGDYNGIMGMIGVARQSGADNGLLSDCKSLWIDEHYYDADDLRNFIMNGLFCRGLGEEWLDYT